MRRLVPLAYRVLDSFPTGDRSNAFNRDSGIHRCTARRDGRQMSPSTNSAAKGRMRSAIDKLAMGAILLLFVSACADLNRMFPLERYEPWRKDAPR